MPYVALEVLRGEAHRKSPDIYAFGIILWALCAGKLPFGELGSDENLQGTVYLIWAST